jgi:hypothetical protein
MLAASDQGGEYQLQAGLLSEEPRDHLGPSPTFLESPLQQIRRANQLPQPRRQPEVV